MSRRKICPNCGARNLAKILYGYPIYDEEMRKKIDDGEICVGGCCELEDGAKYMCNECGVYIYDDGRFELNEDT
jgi:predicted RNA-binding Zn-ribbon protein involved in translation (DUF1610 family)